MQLTDFLESINQTKKNLIRDSESPEAALKLYPAFIVMSLMGADKSTVLYANELNIRCLSTYGLTPRMQYDYFLNVIPKGRRFNKFLKPGKDDKISFLMRVNNMSYDKARIAADLIPDDVYSAMKDKDESVGGEQKPKNLRGASASKPNDKTGDSQHTA